MSNPRRQKQQQVKKKIAQILKSVKQQKQHIENQLAKNDFKIKHLCEEYEKLRHETNFNELTTNQTIILKSIIDGLQEANVNPVEILGSHASKFGNGEGEGNRNMGDLSDNEIIQIQESIIKNLWEEIRKAEEGGLQGKQNNIVKK